jgi:hypothetical protein
MTSFDDAEPANVRGAATEAMAAEHLSTDDDLPLPRDVRTVFQGSTFFLLLLGACYLAAEMVLSIVLAALTNRTKSLIGTHFFCVWVFVSHQFRVRRSLGFGNPLLEGWAVCLIRSDRAETGPYYLPPLLYQTS